MEGGKRGNVKEAPVIKAVGSSTLNKAVVIVIGSGGGDCSDGIESRVFTHGSCGIGVIQICVVIQIHPLSRVFFYPIFSLKSTQPSLQICVRVMHSI